LSGIARLIIVPPSSPLPIGGSGLFLCRDDEDTYAFKYWLLAGLSGDDEDEIDVDEDVMDLTIVNAFDFADVAYHDDPKAPKVAEK